MYNENKCCYENKCCEKKIVRPEPVQVEKKECNWKEDYCKCYCKCLNHRDCRLGSDTETEDAE